MAINIQEFIARFEAEAALVRKYEAAISAIEAAIDRAFEEEVDMSETQRWPNSYHMCLYFDSAEAEDVHDEPAVWRELRRCYLNAGFTEVDFRVINCCTYVELTAFRDCAADPPLPVSLCL